MAYPGIGFELMQPREIEGHGRLPPIGFEKIPVGSQPPHPDATDGLAPPQPGFYPDLNEATGNGSSPEVDPSNVKVDICEDASQPLQDETNSRSKQNLKTTMFFNDGIRRIDYILAYTEGDVGINVDEKRLNKLSKKDESKRECRKTYLNNLIEDGMELEVEDKKESQDGKTFFVKVHAPWEILTRFAELMNMKMPMKIDGEAVENDIDIKANACCDKMPHCFQVDTDLVPPEKEYFTTPFKRNRVELFIIEDKDTFFSNAERSRLVHEVLNRTRFGESRIDIGLRKLINHGVFTAVFPLHEGSYRSEHSIKTHGADNDRHLLYETWARPACWYKFQPLDLIRRYFGEKIGIYFTWLGFYTTMLIPASLVGFIVFIYGCATVLSNTPTNEICYDEAVSNITMCPICDLRCSYWRLKESCLYSQLTYLFDNGATVFFAIFMSLWATLFLEFWKRTEKEIQYEWDVANFEDVEENLRPEYEVRVTHKKVNPATQQLEPHLPLYNSGSRICASFAVILFMICLVLAAVFAVIVYRVFIVALLYLGSETLRPYARITTTVTGACLSLIVITAFNKLYTVIAIALTHFECPRTETEFEDHLTFKMFLFQFVNYYSTIFYIAFFKGRFTGTPGKYDYSVTGYRGEECDPAGCMIGLCIQLLIVMVGKQALNNAKELILPIVFNKIRAKKSKKVELQDDNVYTRWERDFDLASMPDLGLFEEYLEMVVQFGFITIFVAAFPLAPLFALINNIIEIRLDAYKFVTQWRRPLAARGQDIGVWADIMTSISYLAVLSNAFIIAYTSDFVPRTIYRFTGGQNFTLHGYVEYSLSLFDVRDFQSESRLNQSVHDVGFGNVTYCRYRGYLAPPDDNKPYSFTMTYWHIFAARLAFVIVFEHFVFALKAFIDWMVPDTSYMVKQQILREQYLTRQALTTTEAMRAKQARQRKDAASSAATSVESITAL
ncbi:anoctamin-4-like isoform X2 [Lineus longissimus]|uniref:anoctamin-4-like isoform X2 n=1 Tax=Lineus longissimus TaxID=88925 RepID=UPI002B4C49AA